MSDGVTQRVFLPIDLSGFDDEVLIHDAQLILTVVPGTYSGGDPTVTIYVPDCVDAADPCVESGTNVASSFINTATNQIEVRVLDAVQQFLNEADGDDAFVIRYTNEGTDARRVEFYNASTNPTLVPQLRILLSTKPEFPRP